MPTRPRPPAPPPSFAALVGALRLAPVDPPAAPGECLGATDVIDIDHRSVERKAAALARASKTQVDKARAVFEFVRDEIPYTFGPVVESRASWRASRTLARGNGFCQQKSVLLVALARAAGVPAQLGYQHLKDYKIVGTRYEVGLPGGVIHFHGLAYLYIDGGWRRVDATLDRVLVERRGYRLADFNETGDTLLPATDLAGAPHFAVLEEFGPFPDLPRALSDCLSAITRYWKEWRALVRRTGATM